MCQEKLSSMPIRVKWCAVAKDRLWLFTYIDLSQGLLSDKQGLFRIWLEKGAILNPVLPDKQFFIVGGRQARSQVLRFSGAGFLFLLCV